MKKRATLYNKMYTNALRRHTVYIPELVVVTTKVLEMARFASLILFIASSTSLFSSCGVGPCGFTMAFLLWFTLQGTDCLLTCTGILYGGIGALCYYLLKSMRSYTDWFVRTPFGYQCVCNVHRGLAPYVFKLLRKKTTLQHVIYMQK